MKKELVSFIAVLANLILTVFKLAVGLISGSSAIFAEGIHSGMDIVSSGISYFGIKTSKKPIDEKHPYGHYKSETIAGFIITIMLFASAIWIILEAAANLFIPKTIEISYLAIGVMLFSALINEIMARFKSKYGKEYESMSLIADASHSRVDVLTSLGVLAGFMLSAFWIHADSITAVLVGIYIIWNSLKLGRETTDTLLNVSAGEEIENKIRNIVRKEGIEISDLKTQKLGSRVFAELKIKLDPKLKVDEASRISNKLESRITKYIPEIKYVVIQIESHDVSESYFKGRFGGMRWGKLGGFGMGPSGQCECPKCGHNMPHKRGVPCYTRTCPKCGTKMTRKR